MDRNGNQCFVCDTESTFYCNTNNIFSIVSKHTETPIYKFLEKFLDESLSRSSTKVICQDCLLKIDDFDLYQKNALRIERELIEIINRTHNRYENVESVSTTKYVKEEIEDDTSSQNLIDKLKNVEVTIDEKPVQMKCNVCLETFASLADMTAHSHKRTTKLNRRNSIEKYYITDTETIIIKEEDDNSNPDIIDECDYDCEEDNNDEDFFPKKIKEKKKSKKKLPISTKGPHKCSHCDKIFLAKSEFVIHMKTHEDITKIVCSMCGVTFKTNADLNAHLKLHEGLSKHECAFCNKKFKKKGPLVSHMPIHTGEHPFQCDKCGKQFQHHSSFRMHSMIHDDVRLKKCEVCGFKLRSNSHLTRHMRIHSGEKPFSCPTCNQKFAQRYNMMTHLKAHQGIHREIIKNHPCLICNMKFQSKTKLDYHLSRVHEAISIKNDEIIPL